jgi:hypothetical protein
MFSEKSVPGRVDGARATASRLADGTWLESRAAIAHQEPKITNRYTCYIMYTYQQRRTNRQSQVAHLTDDRRRHFERTRQCRIISQAQVLCYAVQQLVWIVIKQIIFLIQYQISLSYRSMSS